MISIEITIFSILDFFYSFPFLGPKFYEMPQQFMQFMEETLLDCQKKIVEKDGHVFMQPPNSM